MLKIIIIAAIFMLPCLFTTAQNTLTVELVNADGAKVSNASIRIKKLNLLICFQSLSQTNRFSCTLTGVEKKDSISIQVTHPDYQLQTVYLTAAAITAAPLKITLHPRAKELQEIKVQPSVWKRGDTTIYKVDSFKTGEEQKLKDILRKMPGFVINEEGELKFKGKQVAKIFIEGESLFADRPTLLLETFPAHVLHEIEAIENNAKNRLLKGISTKEQTVVNLKLKKNGLSVFGDVDGKLTTNERYAINPTLFSVQNKFKTGYIGFHNNLGSLLPQQNKSTEAEPEPTLPVLQQQRPATINNFSNSRYLQNRVLSEQISTSYTLFRRLKGNSELSYSNDRIRQSTNGTLLLVDSLSVFERTETESFTGTIQTWLVKQDLELELTKQKNVTGSFSWKQEQLNQRQQQTIQQSGIVTDFVTRLTGPSNQLQGIITFTNRQAENKAYTTNYKASLHSFSPTGIATNPLYPLLFNSSNPNVQAARFRQEASFFTQELQTDFLKKKNNRLQEYNFFFRHELLTTTHQTSLSEGEQLPAVESIPSLSNGGRYSSLQAGTNSGYQFQKTGLRFQANWQLAVNHLTRTDVTAVKEQRFLPQLEGKASLWKRKTGGKWAFSSVASFSLKPGSLHNQVQFLRAFSPQLFMQSSLPLRAIPEYSLMLSTFRGNGLYQRISFSFQVRQRLVSEVMLPGYNGVFAITSNKLVPLPTTNYIATFNYYLFQPRGKVKWDWNTTFSRTEFLQYTPAGNIAQAGALFVASFIHTERTLFKKLFLKSKAGFFYQKNQNRLKEAGLFRQPVLNYRMELTSRYHVSDRFSAGVLGQWYHFRPVGSDPLSLLFTDVDLSWRPRKWKHDFRILAENVFNQQQYILFSNTPFQLNQQTIPLIGRNIQVSFKYNF